jgi:hypothetical protein
MTLSFLFLLRMSAALGPASRVDVEREIFYRLKFHPPAEFLRDDTEPLLFGARFRSFANGQ